MAPATDTYVEEIACDVPADANLHRWPGTEPEIRTPAVARWLVRLALIAARDAVPMIQKDAADALGWSMSKLQRIETGQVTISDEGLRKLLRLYGVKQDTGWLIQLADTARARLKPWHNPTLRDRDPFKHTVTQFEHDAGRIRWCESGSIPDPLQIDQYSAALHSLMATEFPPQICAAHAAAHALRRELFLSSSGRRPVYQVILDEAVICRPYGGFIVLRDQLEALLESIRSGDLELAIVPYESGIPFAVNTPFTLMDIYQCDHTVLALPCGVSGPTVTAVAPDGEFYLRLWRRLWGTRDPAVTELVLLRHLQKINSRWR